jgi:hypothetical protein
MAGLAGFRVEGLRELNRAFARASGDVKKGMRTELRKVAEPVKPVATGLAQANISNLGGGRWSEFRIGVTQSAVYIAPKARRKSGSPRPNLAPLLLKKSMIPAVKSKEGDIERGFEAWLESINHRAGL